ncbi:hypothetical protein [Synechococcus sp. UW179B]|uniref:hypothetical protein n=1 Tax=Synechococcus sp. UW179B TaxID=2575516 RepID=UPI001FCB690B|nr:hypothetical protein [Synechococcus sp. UW179B]
MPKKKPPQTLPEDWVRGERKSLRVVEDLGFPSRGVPDGLVVQKITKSKNLEATYLPLAEDDPRDAGGGARGGKKRRVRRRASTGTQDPWEAAQKAILWAKADLQRLRTRREETEEQKHHSLHAYWERWLVKETKRRAGTRSASRIRDDILKWEGEGYGIKHQPWSNKPVDRINTLDLEDYWSVLDQRRTPTNDMSGTKKQQKTLIRKLLTEARQQDFPHLVIPDFPEISSQKKQVRHLTRKEWDLLLKKVVELSEGAARKDLSVSDYQDLQFSKANNQNQRNWVDLYDCLNLMWFFYLRAEDLPRIRAEWFQDRGEEIVCVLEITKGDRNKQETRHYRSDALKNWRRMNQRRPKGFLVFPHTKRSAGETNSTLKRTWNLLLQKALDACEIPSEGMTMTNIRHTAFRLTLEEAPELGQAPAIHSFAENGMTSAKMLQETYLRFIEQESTAKKVRAKIKPGPWSMVRGRIEDPD